MDPDDTTAAGGPDGDPTAAWTDPERLTEQQVEVGRLRPDPWFVPDRLSVAGCFVAFARGEEGPGHIGDHAWVGAATVSDPPGPVTTAVTTDRAAGPYVPGLLALREGRMMQGALCGLFASAGRPDAVMVDATGRDHPRGCGLAVHLGWVLDVPTVGVTHRLLTDRHREPPELRARGDASPIEVRGEAVAAWVCTRDGARPVVVHAGWRTDVATALEATLRLTAGARTPEPLRVARRVAREARAAAERR